MSLLDFAMFDVEPELSVRWDEKANQLRYVAGSMRHGVKTGGRFARFGDLKPAVVLKALGYQVRRVTRALVIDPEGNRIEGETLRRIALEAYRARVPLCRSIAMSAAA